MKILNKAVIVLVEVLCLTTSNDGVFGFTTNSQRMSSLGHAVAFIDRTTRGKIGVTVDSVDITATFDEDLEDDHNAPSERHTTSDDINDENDMIVKAQLKFIGPYPCLGMRFPNLATSAQRSKNATGISLDFVVDTGANLNTINAQVAQELQLKVVGSALPGTGAAGPIEGGANTFSLGDCQLEGILSLTQNNETPRSDSDQQQGTTSVKQADGEKPFTFMTGLTASALPIASPASAGLLSLAFLYSFEGGVEFNWGGTRIQQGQESPANVAETPSFTFYGEKDLTLDSILNNMQCVPIKSLPATNLPSVTININGIEMPALLDTGSPITVLNSQAAQIAGIDTVNAPQPAQAQGNPFSRFLSNVKEAQEAAQAAARGDIITIGGVNGERVNLVKSLSPVDVSLVGDDADRNMVDFGKSNIFVGDLPGLAALNGLGDDAPPAVVLGMDVLRLRPRMLLRAQQNEVYF